jgi:hypothetical protein
VLVKEVQVGTRAFLRRVAGLGGDVGDRAPLGDEQRDERVPQVVRPWRGIVLAELQRAPRGRLEGPPAPVAEVVVAPGLAVRTREQVAAPEPLLRRRESVGGEVPSDRREQADGSRLARLGVLLCAEADRRLDQQRPVANTTLRRWRSAGLCSRVRKRLTR